MGTQKQEFPTGAESSLLLALEPGMHYSLEQIAELGEKIRLGRRQAKQIMRFLMMRRAVDLVSRKEHAPKRFRLTCLGKKKADIMRSEIARGEAKILKKSSKKNSYCGNVRTARFCKEEKFEMKKNVRGNSQIWGAVLNFLFHKDISHKFSKEEFVATLGAKEVVFNGKLIYFDPDEAKTMLRSMRKDKVLHMDGDGIITLTKRGRQMLHNKFGIGEYVPSRREESHSVIYSLAIKLGMITKAWRGGFRALKKLIVAALVKLFASILSKRTILEIATVTQ